jgi:hypothetical protein
MAGPCGCRILSYNDDHILLPELKSFCSNAYLLIRFVGQFFCSSVRVLKSVQMSFFSEAK